MQPIFRERALKNVRQALEDYAEAGNLEHPGMVGRVREIVAKRLLNPTLPRNVEAVLDCKIVDAFGGTTPQTDIVLFSRGILPPILFGEHDVAAVPVEAAIYSFEVKSRLDMGELRRSVETARAIARLKHCSGFYADDGREIQHRVFPVVSILFAFQSDLTKKSELDRYAEVDDRWNNGPAIAAICVVGRGYWWWGSDHKWYFLDPTDNHDEVVKLVAGTANTISRHLQKRGFPAIGHYIMDEGQSSRPVDIESGSSLANDRTKRSPDEPP